MPSAESSLSVAIQATADFIAAQMADDVVVSVDAPQRAQKRAEDGDVHVLNMFVYRIAPSGFHADPGNDEPTFVRASLLITAFPSGQGDPPPDSDLRVLGQALRVLQSFPVIPAVLPGAAPVGAPPDDFRNPAGKVTSYQLQAALQAPTMEELNHIWTTQGGELAYRLSAAYELSLIPIEPLSHADPAPLVAAAEMQMIAGTAGGLFQMFVTGDRLFSHQTMPAGTPQVAAALTGQKDRKVGVIVEWRRAGGVVERQPVQAFVLATADINAADARHDIALVNPVLGDVAEMQTVLLGDDDLPLYGAAPANLITLEIGA